MYDIEQFLKEAGAERVNEKAMVSLERELQDTVNGLVDQASVYANYAGRSKLINLSDITLAKRADRQVNYPLKYKGKKARLSGSIVKRKFIPPKLSLVNNMPVIKQGRILQ
jgi:histone H3/H4